MLLWNLDLLLRRPQLFLILLVTTSIALLVAITVHEFSHALMAHNLGDPTAKRQGRLSLNPLVHLDPVGTLMLFLVGLGWGKPVPVNPYYLRQGARTGMALVGAGGPVSNLLVAWLFALLIRYVPALQSSYVFDLVGAIMLYNVLLAVFNLIPVAPLDGFNIALGVLPRNLAYSLARTQRFGPIILLGVVFLVVYSGALSLVVRLISSLMLGQRLF